MDQPERVVFDTNVYIAGLLWRGKPYYCLLLAREGKVKLIYCTEMAAELTTKLREKFKFSENQIQGVVYDLKRVAEKVEITNKLHAVKKDPDDDKIIECALIGKATTIVSDDHHLTDLEEYEGIKIFTSAQFWDRYAK